MQSTLAEGDLAPDHTNPAIVRILVCVDTVQRMGELLADEARCSTPGGRIPRSS